MTALLTIATFAASLGLLSNYLETEAERLGVAGYRDRDRPEM